MDSKVKEEVQKYCEETRSSESVAKTLFKAVKNETLTEDEFIDAIGDILFASYREGQLSEESE